VNARLSRKTNCAQSKNSNAEALALLFATKTSLIQTIVAVEFNRA